MKHIHDARTAIDSLRGYTVLEALFLLIIIGIILLISFGGYQQYQRKSSISSNAHEISAQLERAYTMSVVDYAGSQYGIHFENDRYVLFTAPTYQDGQAGNEVRILDGFQFENPMVFSDGTGGKTRNVMFAVLSGQTVNTGTIKLMSIADAALYRFISINGNGTVLID